MSPISCRSSSTTCRTHPRACSRWAAATREGSFRISYGAATTPSASTREHRPLHGFARRRGHDQLFDPGNRLASTKHQRIALALPRLRVGSGGRDLNVDHVVRLRLFIHRRPGRFFISNLLELLGHLLVANDHFWTVHAEAVGAREIYGRPYLEVQLEREWLAFLELEVVDVGLCRDLDALLLNEFLVGLADQRLQSFLADRLAELFSDYRRRCLARPVRDMAST